VSKQTTAGRWTAEPPTVPGWYWWRQERNDEQQCVFVYQCSFGMRSWRVEELHAYSLDDGEWWSVPIQEPPR